MTPEEAKKVVSILSVAFRKDGIDKKTLDAYAMCISDFPYDLAQASVLKIIAEQDFFPSIAQIRKTAISLSLGLKTAGEAWEIVEQAVMKCGSYRRPNFKDPLIQKAVNMIGWQELCLSERISVERAHFIRVYEQLVEKERSRRNLFPLLKTFRVSLPEKPDTPPFQDSLQKPTEKREGWKPIGGLLDRLLPGRRSAKN